LNRPFDHRTEYDARMHRVLEYIDRRLDQSLPLTDLADVAHFSPFHFHRLFTAWMGETLGNYLRRRRVEVAAMRLAAQVCFPVTMGALGIRRSSICTSNSSTVNPPSLRTCAI
jgi:AraC family transcriptional regulator